MPAKIPLLILGISTDGPPNQMVWDSNLSNLFQVFGGYYSQQKIIYNTLTEATTSLTLDFPIWGPLLLSDVSYRVPRPDPLYQPSLSDQTLTFGTIGTSSMMLRASYRPHLGENDLLLSAQTVSQLAQRTPALVRVGGTYATFEYGGWVFSAKYPGQRYNKVLLLFSASSLSVMHSNRVMTFDLTVSSFREDINTLCQAGTCPVECLSAGDIALTGSYYLSGGTDGSLTEAAVEEALPLLDLTEVGAVLINLPLTDSLYQILRPYMSKTDQPSTIFFIQAPTRLTSEPIYFYSKRINEEIPMRHDFLVTVMGSAFFPLEGNRVMRPAAEGVAAGYLMNPLRSPSNMGTKSIGHTPILIKDELQDLLMCGVTALNRFIGSGISVYRGVASSGRRLFDQIICLQETSYRVVQATKTLLGQPYREDLEPIVQQRLVAALQSLPYGTLQKVSVETYLSEFYVTVDLLVGGEILSMSLTVMNRG